MRAVIAADALVLVELPSGTSGASGAAQEPADDEQDEDRSDDGPDDAAEVERVGVSDPEEASEDEPTHQRAHEAKQDRREPRLPTFKVLERVVGNHEASYSAGDKAKDESTDHDGSSTSMGPVRTTNFVLLAD
jgi:hypothetical protein